MKAFLCKEFGPVDSHQVEEIDDPIAGPGQVVVDIKATGISFPDVLIVQGLYQFKPPFPFSPGSEISGVVSSVGEGVTMPSVHALIGEWLPPEVRCHLQLLGLCHIAE